MDYRDLLSVLCLQCNCQCDNVFEYQRHVEECHSNKLPAKTVASYSSDDEPHFGSHVENPAASTNVLNCVEIYPEAVEGAASPVPGSVPWFGSVPRTSSSHYHVSSGSQERAAVVSSASSARSEPTNNLHRLPNTVTQTVTNSLARGHQVQPLRRPLKKRLIFLFNSSTSVGTAKGHTPLGAGLSKEDLAHLGNANPSIRLPILNDLINVNTASVPEIVEQANLHASVPLLKSEPLLYGTSSSETVNRISAPQIQYVNQSTNQKTASVPAIVLKPSPYENANIQLPIFPKPMLDGNSSRQPVIYVSSSKTQDVNQKQIKVEELSTNQSDPTLVDMSQRKKTLAQHYMEEINTLDKRITVKPPQTQEHLVSDTVKKSQTLDTVPVERSSHDLVPQKPSSILLQGNDPISKDWDYYVMGVSREVRQAGSNQQQSSVSSGITLFSCEICLRVFVNDEDLKIHMSFCHPKKITSDEGADKESKSGYQALTPTEWNILKEASLKEGKNHKQKPCRSMSTCEYCNKTMSSRNLARHMRTHGLNELCHVCGMNFSGRYNLTKHMHLHDTLYQYICDVCGVGKKTKAQLASHQSVHSGVWPFRCQYCGKGIGSNARLVLHEQRHRGELPFSCLLCPISFKTKNSLKKHLAEGQHRPNVSDREEEQEKMKQSLEFPPKKEKGKQNRRKLKGNDKDSIESEESIDSEDEESFEITESESEDSDCIAYADDSDDYLEDEVNTDTDEVWIPTKQRKVQTGRLDTIESISPHAPTSPTDHVTFRSDDSDLKEASSNTDDHDPETTLSDTVTTDGPQSSKDTVTYTQDAQGLDDSEDFEIPFTTIMPSFLT